MHLKRQEVTTKIPITRKGTTYVARSSSDLNNSVPIVIAVRDMLKLAKNTAEVKKMIHEKKLKINGRIAKDFRESVKLFGIFEADKKYVLTISDVHRFIFEETKSTDRLCKVLGKKLLSKNKIQLNLHDGTNVISKEKIKTNDSLYLSQDNKITKHIPMEKGKNIFVMSGKYLGQEGKIAEIKGRMVTIKLTNREESVTLQDKQIIVQ